MIRKLRWKFSAIMMTIVAFLLAVIFITLYYTTKANCGPASSLPPPQAGTSSDGG